MLARALRFPLVAAVLAIVAACGSAGSGNAARNAESEANGGAPWRSPHFPLSVDASGRFLVDADQQPFLVHGDTAWSLIAELDDAEVDRYLADRRARGFNTLLVNLLEHKFASKAPANAAGDPPFDVAGDFATPNERYFEHADRVLRRAFEEGFAVLLAPAYMGNGGGDEGWYQEMRRSGAAKLALFGHFLGKRYAGTQNIVWVHGGDYNPPDKRLATAIVEGIQAEDSRALNTAHCGPETAGADYWGAEPWLQINTVYTYEPVYLAAARQYRVQPRRPFILIESHYENEYHSTERQLRTQAFHALLSGAAGQVFGNSPIWHFSGPGLFPGPPDWHAELSGRGSVSMTNIRRLLEPLPWWKLEPDEGATFVTGELESGRNRTVAAVARDRSFALVYVPTAVVIDVNVGMLAGPRVSWRWFDPANGKYVAGATSVTPASGMRTIPHLLNSAGQWDQVLVVESVP